MNPNAFGCTGIRTSATVDPGAESRKSISSSSCRGIGSPGDRFATGGNVPRLSSGDPGADNVEVTPAVIRRATPLLAALVLLAGCAPSFHPDGSAVVPPEAAAVDTSRPDRVIGNGTPASCTSEAVSSSMPRA